MNFHDAKLKTFSLAGIRESLPEIFDQALKAFYNSFDLKKIDIKDVVIEATIGLIKVVLLPTTTLAF